MAFSQVEVASSFGCVLKDHNRRERCNRSECNTTIASAAVFEKNLKELVRDHLCISVSSSSSSSVVEEDDDKNLHNHHENLTTTINITKQDNKMIDDKEDMMNGKQQQHAKILDRWAAKQAEEMVSTIESSAPSSSSSSSCQKPASSLVQMWEARLQPAHIKVDRCNSYKNSPKSVATATCVSAANNIDILHPKIDGSGSAPASQLGSRSSSSKTSPSSLAANDDLADTNNVIVVASMSSTNEMMMTASSSSSTRTSGVNEDLLAGLEGRSSCSDTDAGEIERVRVADIIKRLKCDNEQVVCDPSPRRIAEAGPDPKSFSLVVNVNSLKIRGRQAFNDLLMQMEQERKKELNSILDRNSVSKFAHRGRIQSMLRVRSLQRGMAIQNRQHEQYQSAQCTTPSHANRSHQPSTIMSLKERFSKGIGDAATSSLTPKICKEIENSIANNENQNHTKQPIKSNHCGGMAVSFNNHQAQAATTSKSCKEMDKCIIVDNKNGSTIDHNRSVPSSTEYHQWQASKTGKGIDNCTANSLHGSTMMMRTDNSRDFCTNEQQGDTLSQKSEVHDEINEESSAKSDVTWQGTSSEINNFGAGESMDNWEGNDIMDGEQDFEDRNYDWFADIARPRSYWEDIRKGWYEEMLTCSSEDNEIKQLLQRKTVSSFLTGEFRAKMDQMIMSHVQIQANHEDEELQEEGQERMGQLVMSFLQRQSHSSSGDGEEPIREDVDADDEQEEEDDDDDDDECVEDEQDPNQDEQEEEPENSQPGFRSWQVSRHPSLQSEGSMNQQNHPAIEMDLRGQMEQLQQEMYELRKAMHACLEMQKQMCNNSVKEVVKPDAAMNSNDMTRKERKCCICYDKQVDTFLYRCGHMCTCLRCAHELQWSSGKCPICRAPILDVVRAYMDS